MTLPPGRRKLSLSSRLLRLLEFDPDAIAPVAVAFVLAPPVLLVLGPFPAVRTNGELEVGMKVVPLDVPAIAFAVARNLGRRCGYTEGQGTCGNQKGFAHSVHILLHILSHTMENAQTPRMVAAGMSPRREMLNASGPIGAAHEAERRKMSYV